MNSKMNEATMMQLLEANVLSRCWTEPGQVFSNPQRAPFRVTTYWDDATPGNMGWISRSQVFATLDEALAVASMPMPRGCRRIAVDVAKNRSDWTESGHWEAVGKRLRKQAFQWAKGWSWERVLQVRAYFEGY